jgi:hypothetical protein
MRGSGWLATAAAALICLGSGPAAAQKTKGKGRGRVVTITEVTIVGRVQKPIAATAVSRIEPKLTLSELRQPFVQRIERAIYAEPF